MRRDGTIPFNFLIVYPSVSVQILFTIFPDRGLNLMGWLMLPKSLLGTSNILDAASGEGCRRHIFDFGVVDKERILDEIMYVVPGE